MHAHRAFNLCVHSEIALPELPSGHGPADVTVRQRKPTASALADCSVNTHGSCVTGRIENVLAFEVKEGTSITVFPKEDAGEGLVRELVLGVLMCMILRQRGLLVLHACGVARDGKVFGFAGNSGWGKSTTAEYFQRHGYSVLTDDVLAIDLSGEQPMVVPAFPQIKLRMQAADWFAEGGEALPLLHDKTTKRQQVVAHERFPKTQLPLDRLYILERRIAEANALTPLAQQEAVMEMIQHVRVQNVMTAPEYRKRQFLQCTRLAQSIPVRRLERQFSLEALAEIKALVERDADSQGA